MSEVGKRGLPKTTRATPKPKFDWDDIRVFSSVAETGSMAAAARMLGVTPSMVSKRIDELEARLGATLLIRHAQGVSLTDAGVVVRDHALTMERSAVSIERVVGADDKKREGLVTIRGSDGLAGFWIAPRLAPFQRENPKIRLAFDCTMWSEHPLPEAPELIISVNEEKRLDYVATPLAVLHYVLFAAPCYLNTYGAPRSLTNIAEHRLLNFAPQQRQQHNWHPRAAALRGLIEHSLETNSSAVLMQALSNGAGIAIVPTFVRTFAPELVMVHPEPMAKIQVWLVHHRDALKTARMRVVADWLKSLFDPRDNPWFREEFIHPDDFPPAPAAGC